MIQYVKTIGGAFDSVVNENIEVIWNDGNDDVKKRLWGMTEAEANSHGYYLLTYSDSSAVDTFVNNVIYDDAALGAIVSGKWEVGFTTSPTTAQERDVKRNSKKAEIENALASELLNGQFTSSLGFDIKCRRGGIYNDIQNFGIAIKRGFTAIRDASGAEHTLTVPQLQTIESEMEDYGLSLWQKQWTLNDQVDAATTQAELDAIIW